MLRQSTIDRFPKRQRKQLSLTLPKGEVTRDLEHALNALDEILREYEDHDYCDYPDYRKYYRIFDITAQALCRVTRVLSRSGGPKFV